MKSLAVFCILSLVALVCSQNYAQIGTFEGTYPDNYYGGQLFLCQNGNVLQGSYSQVGIINGVVNGNTATGKFYQAGNNDCNVGDFTWTLTDEGFEGFHTCNAISGSFSWIATKFDVFRPTDDQCALLYDEVGSVQGHWTLTGTKTTIDICFESLKTSNYTVISSYTNTVDPNKGLTYPNIGTIAGFTAFNDKVFFGTWYEDLVAGAVLGFLNYNQDLVLYFWTGIAGRQGASIIDPSEYRTPYQVTYYLSNSVKTSFVQCERYTFLQSYVLNALYYYADGNEQYIYFAYDPNLQFNLEVGFEPVNYKDTQYLKNYNVFGTLDLVNSANYLTLSVVAVVMTLLSVF